VNTGINKVIYYFQTRTYSDVALIGDQAQTIGMLITDQEPPIFIRKELFLKIFSGKEEMENKNCVTLLVLLICDNAA
jgi:hypothetical protein